MTDYLAAIEAKNQRLAERARADLHAALHVHHAAAIRRQRQREFSALKLGIDRLAPKPTEGGEDA